MPQTMPHSPLVSVIVPAFNAAAFIAETLDSAVGQTYSNIEVLVVDDGSQDQTAGIVASIAERDIRVKLFRTPNQGVATSRNLAIEHARGEYIAPLDADDVWYPQKLEKQVACLSRAPSNAGLVYAWSVLLDERGRRTGGCIASRVEGQAYLPLVYSNFVGNASTPLIRRSCLERVGLYSTWYRQQSAQGSEDRELYMRLAEHYEFRVVPEFLVGYRQLAGSMSCDPQSMARAHTLLLQDVRRRHPGIPGRVYRWSESRSCWYLAQKCSRGNDHRRALGCLARSVRLDPFILANRQLYALALKNAFPRLVKPVGAMGRRRGVQCSGAGGTTVTGGERRREKHPRLWQRLNARRLNYLSQQRLPQLSPRADAPWRTAPSGQVTGES